MKKITYSGYWECTLPIPKGWEEVKEGFTKKNDKCMVLIMPKKALKRGEDHNIKGKWKVIKSKYIYSGVFVFRAIIRKKRDN